VKTIILTSKQLIFFKPPRPEGVNNKYDLWKGINGDEYFPKTTGSAFYILKLSKAVERSSEVDEADKLLKDAFKSAPLKKNLDSCRLNKVEHMTV